MNEILNTWQNIRWNKIEEIILKWLLIEYYGILETVKLEIELYKPNNRKHLKNLIFDSEAIREINEEIAKNMFVQKKLTEKEVKFIQKWYKESMFKCAGIDDYVNEIFQTKTPTPPIRTISRKKPLLVLDLDETLIHTVHKPQLEGQYIYISQFDGLYVYIRPFLEYFLLTASKYYHIGIWSSGLEEYVELIIDHIMPQSINPLFIFGRGTCDYRQDYGFNIYVKPLKLLSDFGVNMNQILIVDDSPEKCIDNFNNAIIPSKFMGKSNDMELLLLIDYLEMIHQSKDMTSHAHYTWREIVFDSYLQKIE